jgi:hypothetical protein
MHLSLSDCLEKFIVLIFWGVYVCRIQIETCTDIQRSEMMQPIIFTILASSSTYAISWETFGLKGGRRLQFDTSTTTAAPSSSDTATTAASDVTTVAPGDMSTTAAADSSTTVAGAVGNETTTMAPGNETTVAGAVGNETTTVAPGNETTETILGNETTTVAPLSNETTTAIPTGNVTVIVVDGTNETSPGNGSTVLVNITNVPVQSSFDFDSFAAAYMLNGMSDPTCNSSCCQCISNTSAMMVANSTAGLLEHCAGLPDHAILNICGYLLAQQNISLGMIMGFGDVVQMSNAFCVGDGSCPEPLSAVCASNSTKPTSYGDMPSVYLLGQGYGIPGLEFSYDQCLLITSLQVMETNTRLDNAECENILSAEASSSSSNATASEDVISADNSTMSNSTMGNSTEVAASACPYQVRACQWKQANQDVAWGLRWSSINPFKFARGYCAGVGQY